MPKNSQFAKFLSVSDGNNSNRDRMKSSDEIETTNLQPILEEYPE